MVAPVLRDVQIAPPRVNAAGSQGRIQETLVSCYTGRHSTNCYVEVEFGPTTSYGTTSARTPTAGYHEIPVGELTPGATYQMRVKATDPTDAGNPTYSQNYQITHTPNDVPPGPAVTVNAMTGIVATGAVVNWTTAPAAPRGSVQYGTSPTRLTSTAAENAGADVTTHTTPLSGLTTVTRYYYRIIQPGPTGTTTSPLQSFLTV
jgi:hypothetical protein